MAHLSLLPNGMQQFSDENGVPYLGGFVYMWVPNTETDKDTWVDMDHLALNTNPIVLDAAGRAIIWGEGIYRQKLTDQFGNEIWDRLTLYHDSSDDAEVTTLYDLPVFIQSFPGISEEYPRFVVPRALSLPAALTASRFSIKNAPTALMTFTLYKNGVSIGSVAFAATTGTPTATFASQVGFVAGDIFSMTAPGTQDVSGANVSMTFVFTA